MPEDRKTLADLTPTELVEGRRVPVVDTDLHATLQEFAYGRGRTPDGKDRAVAWADIRFDAPDGRTEDVYWDLGQTYAALGHRFYLTGSRSQALLYTLPD